MDISYHHLANFGLSGGSDGKESACNARNQTVFDLCVGKISWKGNGFPLQYSCLENPMDRGPWQATVHGVTKSQTWLSMCKLTHIEYNIYNCFNHSNLWSHIVALTYYFYWQQSSFIFFFIQSVLYNWLFKICFFILLQIFCF